MVTTIINSLVSISLLLSGGHIISTNLKAHHYSNNDYKEGDKVIKGDRVLVIEAMKMETTINVEKSGTIQKIYVGSGDNVETKDLLIEIK